MPSSGGRSSSVAPSVAGASRAAPHRLRQPQTSRAEGGGERRSLVLVNAVEDDLIAAHDVIGSRVPYGGVTEGSRSRCLCDDRIAAALRRRQPLGTVRWSVGFETNDRCARPTRDGLVLAHASGSVDAAKTPHARRVFCGNAARPLLEGFFGREPGPDPVCNLVDRDSRLVPERPDLFRLLACCL